MLAGDAHEMLSEVDNWDLSVHRREATRVQNRCKVEVGSLENQPKPRTGKDGLLYHARLGLVGWISARTRKQPVQVTRDRTDKPAQSPRDGHYDVSEYFWLMDISLNALLPYLPDNHDRAHILRELPRSTQLRC